MLDYIKTFKKLSLGWKIFAFFVLSLWILSFLFALTAKDFISQLTGKSKINFIHALKMSDENASKETKKAFSDLVCAGSVFNSQEANDDEFKPKNDEIVVSEFNRISSAEQNVSWDLIKSLRNNDLDNYISSKYDLEYAILNLGETMRNIAYIAEYMKSVHPEVDCSHVFSALLKKSSIMSQNTIPGFYDSFVFQKYVYTFYYFVKDGLCGEEEMKNMYDAIIQEKKNIKNYDEVFIKECDYALELLNNFNEKHSIKMMYLNIIFGNSAKAVNKVKEAVLAKNYDKCEEIRDKYKRNYILNKIYDLLEYKEFRKFFINQLSKLALLQAELEYRLNLPITAIDPEDGKPIRFVEENGKKNFYCLGAFNTDENGKGKNIAYPISESWRKKYEERKAELKLKFGK